MNSNKTAKTSKLYNFSKIYNVSLDIKQVQTKKYTSQGSSFHSRPRYISRDSGKSYFSSLWQAELEQERENFEITQFFEN